MPDDVRYRTTFRIWKEFRFEAAHRLTRVPATHQCARVHGHACVVRVECAGTLDPQHDWVIDYADIAAAARPVVAELDHRNLNDILPGETTAENVAFWILTRLRTALPSLEAVEVFETPGTGVRVECDAESRG